MSVKSISSNELLSASVSLYKELLTILKCAKNLDKDFTKEDR